jgi:GNAT superfamily N-acetyltransferase
VIRPFRDDDAEAVAALLAEDVTPHALTAPGVRHWLASQPARAHARTWVALADDRVVGWSRARLQWSTGVADLGELWAFVGPAYRRRGLGAELFEAAVAHLESVGARSVESWASAEDGDRFLLARSFTPVRTQQMLRLELAGADLSRFAPLREEAEAQGYSLVPLAAVAARTRELHALDAAATADVPATHAQDDFRYDDWLAETLAHPQLTREGSFVVLAGEEPVAYALLHVDPGSNLAANEMTGTRAGQRRRGLARLAKLATIAWARENGLDAILTSNDGENVAMQRLNESLGYRPAAVETEYRREELR